MCTLYHSPHSAARLHWGVCPSVTNDTAVDLQLKLRDGFDIGANPENLTLFLDLFRINSLCSYVALEMPNYPCSSQTAVVAMDEVGRGVVRFSARH